MVKRETNLKKVAIVIPRYGPVGGAERFACELAERLSRNERYEIHVFANRWQRKSPGITFHKVPIITFPKFLTTISFDVFAERKIAAMKFDIVHAHDRMFNADVFTMHGLPHRLWVRDIRKKPMNLFDYGTAWVERKLVANPRCKSFLPVSHLAREKFLEAYPAVDSAKVQVIHPGIDIDRFRQFDREEARREIRNLFHIDPDDFVILFVSMNFDIKGLDRIFSGVAAFKSKYPGEKIKILVVGKGNEKKYRDMAHKLSLGQAVIFAGIQKENLERIYLASDAYAMLSKFDTFGIVVLEAMAAALPVIISTNVGARDIVRDGSNGFIIDNVEDSHEISEKIFRMMNSTFRAKIAQAAYDRALKQSWDVVVDRVHALYNKIVSSSAVD